jgi:aminopeptidase-like protein
MACTGRSNFRTRLELAAIFLMHSSAQSAVGAEMHALIARLYPICRSITGDGVRETLRLLRQSVPLQIEEVPTGTKVFDWTVPQEWNIRDAWIKDSTGNKLVDFKRLNLHVVGYSQPVRQPISFPDLKPHLHTLPDQPDLVPYRTSYYTKDWGFCLSHEQLKTFRETEQYEVFIDTTLSDGALTYGEYFMKGRKPDEVLISCHICHPSLADDNLSGIAVAMQLAQYLAREPRRYSYRFLFAPGTIGSITWLARNEEITARIRHGFVLTCVGDRGAPTYKRSRRGNAEVDRAFERVLSESGEPHRILDFYPYGYDERQYCSPGFNLPVGCLMRSKHGEFPEYHTSADNLEFVQPEYLTDSLQKCIAVIDMLEQNHAFVNRSPKCEPQLGPRGLYKGLGAGQQKRDLEMALLWVLNLSDGEHSLLQIAERADLPFATVRAAADALLKTDLLELTKQ